MTGVRPFRIIVSIFLCALASVAEPGVVEGTRVTMWRNVPVTSPEGAHLNWYEIKADPEDESHLIVCGAQRNAQDNAYYGVLYSSRDGGKTWRLVLEDRGSTWVSEQSCAFGLRHFAYFVSESSKVVDGMLYHSLGTTRIFVSSDGGERWAQTASTGWADFSNSVVSGVPAQGHQRLYVFYNSNSYYNALKSLGSTLDFFTVSQDGRRVSRRESIRAMASRNYQGVYPSSSAALDDGSVVALYEARKRPTAEDGADLLELGLARIGPSGGQSFTTIATYSARNQSPMCPFSLSASLAYHRGRNLLYVAYGDDTMGHCAVMLSNSADEGQTWSVPHEVQPPLGIHSSMYFPVLAVNRVGVLGLQWRGAAERSPACWFFSVLRDDFKLDDTVCLSDCGRVGSLDSQTSAYLAAFITQPKNGQPISIDLLTVRDYLTRVGIAATPDGAFHPLWSTLGDGVGELRTAQIRFDASSQSASIQPVQQTDLRDITDKITVIYGGEERLDHETNDVMLAISFRNNGQLPIPSPLYLRLEDAASEFGDVVVVNRETVTSQGTHYIELPDLSRNTFLAPGATSQIYQLVFHFTRQTDAAHSRYFILKLQARVFCKQ
jgi:hypothetical protein